MFLAHIGGAMSRVPEGATAYPQRKSHYIMNVHARWRDPGQDDACIGWARKLFDAAAPFSAGTAYINFMPADEAGRVQGVYAGNLARLAEVKRKYDPGNLFRLNHNIAPAAVRKAAE